jgi:hypothetical protein
LMSRPNWDVVGGCAAYEKGNLLLPLHGLRE